MSQPEGLHERTSRGKAAVRRVLGVRPDASDAEISRAARRSRENSSGILPDRSAMILDASRKRTLTTLSLPPNATDEDIRKAREKLVKSILGKE